MRPDASRTVSADVRLLTVTTTSGRSAMVLGCLAAAVDRPAHLRDGPLSRRTLRRRFFSAARASGGSRACRPARSAARRWAPESARRPRIAPRIQPLQQCGRRVKSLRERFERRRVSQRGQLRLLHQVARNRRRERACGVLRCDGVRRERLDRRQAPRRAFCWSIRASAFLVFVPIGRRSRRARSRRDRA